MINEQSDITSKSASSATYRPWFNSKISRHAVFVKEWVHWQINEEKKTPHYVLQSIWAVVSQRMNSELDEKMSNQPQLRSDLVTIIRKYEQPQYVAMMERELNELPSTELRTRANEIYLMRYQIDMLEEYCASLSRKKIVLTMESIKIKEECDADGNIDTFESWKNERYAELSKQTNEYMNEAVERKLLQLKSHITKKEPCDFFDVNFIKHIACDLFRKDFQKLRAQYPITQKESFKAMLQQGVKNEYNIRFYWWYGALLFGLIATAVTSATVAGLFEKGQERFNPILEKFWELESHDPIFRGAGFGVFGIALILLWMLHPVDEQPAQKRIRVAKVN